VPHRRLLPHQVRLCSSNGGGWLCDRGRQCYSFMVPCRCSCQFQNLHIGKVSDRHALTVLLLFRLSFSSVGLSWVHILVMRRLLYCSPSGGTSTLRRCGACRAVGHQLPRCPLYLKGEVQSGCGSPSCPQCAVSFTKCGAKGHSEDTLVEAVRKGTPARFACPHLDEEVMHDRMMRQATPTVRAQREVARAGKKWLAEISWNSGSRLISHLRQSALVDELGLAGAAATAPVRMSEGVAAALEDDGAPRSASRMLGAFVADCAAHGRAGGLTAPPGAPRDA